MTVPAWSITGETSYTSRVMAVGRLTAETILNSGAYLSSTFLAAFTMASGRSSSPMQVLSSQPLLLTCLRKSVRKGPQMAS